MLKDLINFVILKRKTILLILTTLSLSLQVKNNDFSLKIESFFYFKKKIHFSY